MAVPLPRLRADLDIMPSPLPEQPGLIIRDPFRFSDVTLLIPPLLARCLGCFDGEHDVGDLGAAIARLSGKVAVGEAARRLIASLHEAGFLDDDRFAELRGAREQEFAALEERTSAHAGSGYPSEVAALKDTLRGYFDGAGGGQKSKPNDKPKRPSAKGFIGLAAPHVSPEGGVASYAAAYAALPKPTKREVTREVMRDAKGRGDDRIFIVLGTSHYGEPDRFGLTRKPFTTPFGTAPTETALVDELCRTAAASVTVEDYCHAVEHSIEFQVVFLQYLLGPRVRILPILCGAFSAGIEPGTLPEANDHVARFTGALGELAAREQGRVCFVLGVDFAHVGRRYGDRSAARAYEGALATVAERDDARVQRIAAGDAEGFWNLVMERGDDDLKWCGSSPIYTFLRAVPQARGRRLAYQQWNIDDASVVSFGALAFSEESAGGAREKA
jgi:AmmeMemoRadiSam system protein B